MITFEYNLECLLSSILIAVMSILISAGFFEDSMFLNRLHFTELWGWVCFGQY